MKSEKERLTTKQNTKHKTQNTKHKTQNTKHKTQANLNSLSTNSYQPSTKRMPQFPNITLAILAGGKASRMGGRNKALLQIEGETFISRIYKNLSPLFQNTIIISNDVKDFDIPEAIVYPDIIENIGPLGGIHSALIYSLNPFVFVVSCDMPYVDPEIASALTEEFIKKYPDILIPVIDTFNEPLFAIYSKTLIAKIEFIASTSKGRPIKDLLNISSTNFFNLSSNPKTTRCFTNINSKDELDRIHLG